MTAAQPAPQPGHHPASRLAYDDASTPQEMSADCRATHEALHLQRAARAAVRPAPSIHFADYPREVAKRGEIEISEAASRLAAAMNLQLDGDA